MTHRELEGWGAGGWGLGWGGVGVWGVGGLSKSIGHTVVGQGAVVSSNRNLKHPNRKI